MYSFNFPDYSDQKLFRILNSELADTLGNLLSRGCAKTVNAQHKYPKLDMVVFEELCKLDATKKLIDLIAQLPGEYRYFYY